MGDTMNKNTLRKLPTMFALAFLTVLSAYAGDIPPAGTAPIKNTVTVRLLGDNKRMPEVTQDDVIVKQGKSQLQVTGWSAAFPAANSWRITQAQLLPRFVVVSSMTPPDSSM